MRSFKKISKYIVLLLLCSFVIFSCDKDDDISNSKEQNQDQDHNATAFAENFGNDISRTFLGNVVDTNSNPIESVLINIGGETAMTDSNGVFIIQNAPIKERFGFVIAEKVGFIHASRAVVPSEGTNKVTIMMLPETVVGSTSSGTQETITLANGASVALEGDFIKSDGTSYTGNVNVILHHLDPSDENMNNQMPGMLYAANAQNEESVLQTFGMLAVELRGSGGEDLNLAESSSAEIRVPLVASLLSDAPSTIPLWYFDETNGYWIEDGQAILVGNEYVGTVTHFSFWSLCTLFQIENSIISIYVKDENQSPLENIKVSIQIENFGQNSGYTNENGIVSGYVPSNQSININIFDSFNCEGNAIYSESIGPFSANTTLNITIPNNPNSITEELAGSFNNCNETTINNGYIFISHSGKVFISPVQNGNFNTNILRCTQNNTFKIEAIDYNTLNTTGEIYYAFNTPYTYLGDLSSCNAIEEFVSFKIGEHIGFIPHGNDINIDLDSGYLFYNCLDILDYGCAFSGITNNVPNGEFPLNNPTAGGFVIEGFNDTYSNGQFYISSARYELESYITRLGNVGEYVDIIFEGTYTSPDETVYPINAIIHSRLNQ